jgi:hypothetical protein
MDDFSRVPTQALCVCDPCKRQILSMNEMPFDIAIEQIELLKQGGLSVRRQCLDEVFDHRAQPSYDL